MKFFIDEAGNFTAEADVSVICSLALPHQTVDAARDTISEFARNWPRKDGELKGGLLSGNHLAALVGILFRHDALLQCIGIDVSLDSQDDIAAHKARQCAGITKYLLPTHPAEVIAKQQALRQTLDAMPNQLYAQFVVLSDLVIAAAEHATLYFTQRRPDDLASFEWTIDAKDPKRVSVQEKWWRDTLGPLGESKSRERPFGTFRGDGYDYTHFDKSFLFEKDLWWPDKPPERITGVDIEKLISKSVQFKDSRSDILVQAADILANFMRRALCGEITDEMAIRNLGRLQILKRRDGVLQSIEMAAFSSNPKARKGIGRVSKLMTESARSMHLRPPS